MGIKIALERIMLVNEASHSQGGGQVWDEKFTMLSQVAMKTLK